jgi:hypothetical protein
LNGSFADTGAEILRAGFAGKRSGRGGLKPGEHLRGPVFEGVRGDLKKAERKAGRCVMTQPASGAPVAECQRDVAGQGVEGTRMERGM